MKKLNIDNPFFNLMEKLGDIIIVNVLFLICSLPVVTMGAATAAMYKTFLEMNDKTGGGPAGAYFKNFRAVLKRSLVPWIFLLISGMVLIFDILFLGETEMVGMWGIVGVVTGCLFLLWEMTAAWIFPVLAQCEPEEKENMKRALILSIRHFPATLMMLVLNNILPFLAVLGIYYVGMAVPIYLTVGFGLTGYVNTIILKRCMPVID